MAITSKSLTKAQVRSFLHMFNFLNVEATLDELTLGQVHYVEHLYGTGVSIRYVPDGGRYYIYLDSEKG